MRKVTSATSFGRTQWTRASSSGEPKRLSLGGGSARGIFFTASGSRRLLRSASVRPFNAGADAAGEDQPAVGRVVAEEQNAEMRPAALWIGPADHDEFLPVEALRLDPDAAVAGRIGRVDLLRDQAFGRARKLGDEWTGLPP
jgi:hypothetical protein